MEGAHDGITYPVVYVLDANGTFGIATETVRLLTLCDGMPEVIVVVCRAPTLGPTR